MDMVDFWDFAFRVLFAGVCDCIVGLDREIKGKPLGARAYILVSIGSAALMAITLNFGLSTP
jgi:putative Mg2+ transporter-C (MgtC) family protein